MVLGAFSDVVKNRSACNCDTLCDPAVYRLGCRGALVRSRRLTQRQTYNEQALRPFRDRGWARTISKDRPGEPGHERIIDLEIREDIGSSSVGARARWPPSIDNAQEISRRQITIRVWVGESEGKFRSCSTSRFILAAHVTNQADLCSERRASIE